MRVNTEIQNVIDRLMYNQLYAPDYPAEDKTTVDREEAEILVWLDYAIAGTRHEDAGAWLALGRSGLVEAFEKLRRGGQIEAARSFENSIRYLRNAVSRKARKADFVAKADGIIVVASPSAMEGDSRSR